MIECTQHHLPIERKPENPELRGTGIRLSKRPKRSDKSNDVGAKVFMKVSWFAVTVTPEALRAAL